MKLKNCQANTSLQSKNEISSYMQSFHFLKQTNKNMHAHAHTCVIRTAFKKAKNQYEFQNNYLLFICIILCHIVQLVHTCTKKVKVGLHRWASCKIRCSKNVYRCGPKNQKWLHTVLYWDIQQVFALLYINHRSAVMNCYSDIHCSLWIEPIELNRI